jgi:hypothetical protein
MEYITGVTTLQAIFTIHWLAYCTWYKGVIRGYGLFSNRLKGKLLKLARKLFNQPDQKENLPPKTWRERIHEYTGIDPLICENCSLEMVLIFACFNLEESWLPKLGINASERIPLKQIKQIKLIPDTG